MAEPISFVAAVEKLAAAIVGGLVLVLGLLGWEWKRNVRKMDRHEDRFVEIEREIACRVTLDVFNDTVNSMRKDIREGNRETRLRLDRLLERER